MESPPLFDVIPSLPLRLTEEQLTLLQRHQQNMEILEVMKARVLHELEGVERAIARARQEFGDLFNSRSILRKLPNDIYVTIFLIAQEATRESAMPPKFTTEIALSHVCKQWRILALSMPWLWTYFRYDGDRYPSLPIDRLKAYIARSQQFPLELFFRFKFVDTAEAREVWKKGYDQLCVILPQVLHRCQSLYIFRGPNSYPTDSLLHGLKGFPAPILESLCLFPNTTSDKVCSSTSSLAGWNPTLFRSEAPALKYVRLDKECLIKFRPPLTSVVHLSLEQTSSPGIGNCATLGFSAFVSLLTLPSLETFSIHGFHRFEKRPSGDLPMIGAKSLKHLRFSLGTGDALESSDMVEYLLSRVSAPNLESLAFRCVSLSRLEHFPAPKGREACYFPSLCVIHLTDCVLPGIDDLGQNNEAYCFQHFANLTRTARRFIIEEEEEESPIGLNALSSLFKLASLGSELGMWPHLEEIELDANVKLADLWDLEDAFPMLQAVTLHQSRLDKLRRHQDWEPFERLYFKTINDGVSLVRPWPNPRVFRRMYMMEEDSPIERCKNLFLCL